MALNNDFPADAYIVTIGAHPPWVSGPIDCTTYTKQAPEPGLGDTVAYRTSWYRYTPASSGSATFYASGVVPTNTGSNIAVQVYVFGANTDGSLNGSDAQGGADNHTDPTTGASYTQSVTGGSTYYLRVGSYADVPVTVYVNVTGPQTGAPVENRISTATQIAINADQVTWRSAPVSDDQLTITSDEPEQYWFRSAFWKLTIPSGTTGNYTFTGSAVAADGSSPTSIYMRVYRRDLNGTLNVVGGGSVASSPVVVDSAGLSTLIVEIANTAQENARWTYRLAVTGPVSAVQANPHQYGSAVLVVPDGQNSFDPGIVSVTSGFDTPENAPPGVTLSGYRGYWYTYAPSGNATVNAQVIAVDDAQANVLPVTLTVWQVSGGVWTQLGTVSGNSGYSGLDIAVTSNVRTYLRLSSTNAAVAKYRLSLSYAPAASSTPLEQPQAADTTQHQYANAVVITGDNQGSYNFYDISNAPWTAAEVSPPGITLIGYKAGWWTHTPVANGTMVVHAGGISNFVDVDVFSVSNGSWTRLYAETSSNTINYSFGVVKANQYYIRIANHDATTTQGVYLQGSVPLGAPLVPLSVPPVALGAHFSAKASMPAPVIPAVAVGVRVKARLVGAVDVVVWTPIGVGVDTGVPVEDVITAANPINAGVQMSAMLVEAGIYLTQPDDGEIVATATPEFIVALDQHDDELSYTIEIQYDEDPAFASPVTISATVDSGDGGLDAIAVTPLSGTTGYWRARLLLDGVEQIAYSGYNTFTIDATVSAQSLPITWTVASNAARPVHLWHFDPPGPQTGELVTAYGQGFGNNPTLSFADTDIPVVSSALIAASTAMSTTGRVIDGGTVDSEHYEVTFYAPEVDDEPGGAFVVED